MSRAVDVTSRRLIQQGLAATRFARPDDVVSWFGAVQAQDYPGARWAIGQRLARGGDGVVADAFDEGRILRTHVLRPTWHFVSPADIRWLLRLSAPRVHQFNGYAYRRDGLDAKTLERTARLICRSLEGRQYLTRTELGAVLARRNLPAAGQPLAHAVMYAELECLICSGPRRGNQFTYALVEERATRPSRSDPEGDEALAALALRYFTAHGPATLRDFVWWSGLTAKQARRGVEASDGALEQATLDGRVHWSGADRVPRGAVDARVHLLPNYDEFLIAYKDRQWTAGTRMPPRFGPAAEHPHQLLLGGKVEGAWRRTVTGSGLLLAVVPYRRLSRQEREELAEAGAKMGRFLGLPATLEVRPVP